MLDDPRSPIISSLKSTEKYAKTLPVDSIDFYRGDETAFLKNPIDSDFYERDHDRLVVLEQEMEKLCEKLHLADSSMDALEENFNEPNAVSEKKAEGDFKWSGNNKIQLEMMYENYLTNHKEGITSEQ